MYTAVLARPKDFPSKIDSRTLATQTYLLKKGAAAPNRRRSRLWRPKQISLTKPPIPRPRAALRCPYSPGGCGRSGAAAATILARHTHTGTHTHTPTTARRQRGRPAGGRRAYPRRVAVRRPPARLEPHIGARGRDAAQSQGQEGRLRLLPARLT